jgi:hypothetical protein
MLAFAAALPHGSKGNRPKRHGPALPYTMRTVICGKGISIPFAIKMV